jgi:hypothetical protein
LGSKELKKVRHLNLSCLQVKEHPWFLNVSWDTLLKKKYKPPFVPLIKSDIDVSNFDPEFTEQPIDTPNQSMSISESL